MIEQQELPTYRATADEFVGVHHTGLEERRYTEVALSPRDFAGDPAELDATPDNIEWWGDVLQALGDYRVLVLESRPEQLDARARVMGYGDFAEWGRDLEAEAYDLEREADLKRRFLGAEVSR